MSIVEDKYIEALSIKDELREVYIAEGRGGFSRRLAMNYNTAGHILQKLGFYSDGTVERRKVHTSQKVLHKNIFEEETEDCAYYLGFILGDGCVRGLGKRKRKNSLNITSKDKEVIEYFCKISKIKKKKINKRVYRKKQYKDNFELNIYDYNTIESLNNYGIFKGKLKKFRKIKILQTNNSHLLRGLFDADGCVTYSNRGKSLHVSICGYESYLSIIYEYFQFLNFKVRYHEGLMYIDIYKQEDILKFYGYIYQNCNICIERKKERFDNYFASEFIPNIKEIKDLNQTIEMCDVEIEKVQCFYGNGIVTHNCGQELKIAGNLSDEPNLIEPFKNNEDLHKKTALNIWGKENYSSDRRKDAKAANFGLLYGGNARTLSRSTGKTELECQGIYDGYWKLMNKLFMWIRLSIDAARTHQNLTTYTYFGRPRRLRWYLNHSDWSKKAFADRTVISHAIQGSCGDIMRVVLVNLYEQIFSNYSTFDEIRYVGTVHDEVLFCIRKINFDYWIDKILDIMTIRMERWPLELNNSIEVGYSYGKMFGFNKNEKGIWEPT